MQLASVPEPLNFNTKMVGAVITDFGSQETKKRFLPPTANPNSAETHAWHLLAVASDLIPPSRRDASGRASPTVDQAQPGRPMDAPAHEITSPALSNQGAGPMKPTVGHVKWLVAALTIRRSHCQRYARPPHPINEKLV